MKHTTFSSTHAAALSILALMWALTTHAYNFAPAGPEFQVHTTTVGAQGGAAIAMDGAGNSVIVWASATYSLSTSGQYGQRFDSAGNRVGPEFKISDYVGGAKRSVAMGPGGEFVVTWDVFFGNDGMIVAKRFDASGNSLPPPTTVPSVPWDLPNAFFVKEITPAVGSWASEWQPAVAMDANGNFVIAWEDRTGQDGDAFGIFAKRYDAAGNEIPPPLGVQGAGVGNEFQVNSFTGYRQMTPNVAINASGDFIITWWSFRQDGGFDAVMAKRYAAAGHELAPANGTQGSGVGNEFQANLFPQQWDFQSPGGAGHAPKVAMGADGNFVITWTGSPIPNASPHGQDCSSGGVFAKRYDGAGNELTPPPGTQGNGIGNEFQVNSRGINSQGPPNVAMTPNGNFVIAWYGDAGQPTGRITAKAYNAVGQVISPPSGSQGSGVCNEFEVTTFTAEGFPTIAMDAHGNFVVVWDDQTGADGDFTAVGLTPAGIFARRYVGSAGPTPISPLTNEPILDCPADLTVNANGSGQATVPDLRSQAVITGVCAPCAAITVTQSPAPGTVVSCGAHPITLTLSDTAGHTASCTAMFNVINPAGSINVVLKVVDQHGQEIPGSRIDVLSQAVNTGDSLLLPEGTQFFLVMPGLRGAVGNTTELFRNDLRVVTCTTTELLFEWITSTFTVRVKDQHGADIPASRFQTAGPSPFITAGDPVTLPITDESVYPTMQGGWLDGYYTFFFPGLGGTPITHTELFRREDNLELSAAPAEFVFEWITSTYTVRLKDQHGVDIPGSRFSGTLLNQNFNTGDLVTLPITDESVYPNMFGAYKDGYFAYLMPGFRGSPGSTTELFRLRRNLELSAAPAEFVFEWLTSTFTVRVRDQHGVDIPASRFQTAGPSPFINAGDPVTLPITDESVYPNMAGGYKDGYFAFLFPGINGNPSTHTELWRREDGLELSVAPVEFPFEWIRHECALEVRDSANAPVPGSDLINLPAYFPAYVPGQPMQMLVNDSATYPTIQGVYASFNFGYPITVIPGDIAPTSATIGFTLLASGESGPASFAIGGNTYSLAFGPCVGDADEEPPTVMCPPARNVSFGGVPPAATSAAQFIAQGGTITDNRDPNPTVTFSDSTTSTCPMIVTRTYTVTDASGNVTTCQQIITVNNLFAGDSIIWHQPLARNGGSEDTDPSAGGTLKYRFKLGSTIPIKIHAQGCGGTDVTGNANVIGKVEVFGDTNCDGVSDGNALPIDYNGVGEAGGVMDKIGGHLKYNLDTKKLPQTTKCYLLQVTVTDTSTGESRSEIVPLQAK